jgi:hypothetical protein
MKKLTQKLAKVYAACISPAALASVLGLGVPSVATAGEEDAKNLVKYHLHSQAYSLTG